MFRFTIRDVLWLTLVVALAVGWWLDRSQVASAKRTLEDDARSMSRFFDANRSPRADNPARMEEYFQMYHGTPTSAP